MERNEILVLAESEQQLATLAPALELGGRMVATSLAEPSALAARVATRPPSAIVAVLGEKADLFLDALEALPAPRPLWLAMGPEDEGRLVLRAMRLGARDYLPADASPVRLVAALSAHGVPAKPGGSGHGSVIAVLAAKGGVGATFVTSQLALTLQGLGADATVVDLNLHSGDAALYMDLHPTYSLADVAKREGALDEIWLRTALQLHPSGVRLLAAPPHAEDAELISSDRVAEAIAIARDLSDWTLLDLARDFDEVTLRGLEVADEILLVTTLDIPSLHRSRCVLSLLERLALPLEHIRLVVNRAGRANQVGEREVFEFIGRGSDARLPNDFDAAQETANYGRPLAEAAPRSALVPAFERLAAQLHEWRGLKPPALAARRGALARAGLWLKTIRHGTD
jgi:pilus assembly protein CpaE